MRLFGSQIRWMAVFTEFKVYTKALKKQPTKTKQLTKQAILKKQQILAQHDQQLFYFEWLTLFSVEKYCLT